MKIRVREYLRDRLSEAQRKRLVDGVNRISGNWLNRVLYGRVRYNEDGLASVHNAEFMQDPRFHRAYTKGAATGSWSGDVHWRAHVYCWAAARGMLVDGDFVECGVNRGGYASTAMDYVDFGESDKRFFLLDTFEDLPEHQISAIERQRGIRRGGYAPSHAAVVQTFATYGARAVVVKGVVPESLDQISSERIAFLSLDMNLREPEIAAAERLWPRLVSGATMLLDDYGWRRHEEQKQAFDEFAARHRVPLLALPTGQALIIKI